MEQSCGWCNFAAQPGTCAGYDASFQLVNIHQEYEAIEQELKGELISNN